MEWAAACGIAKRVEHGGDFGSQFRFGLFGGSLQVDLRQARITFGDEIARSLEILSRRLTYRGLHRLILKLLLAAQFCYAHPPGGVRLLNIGQGSRRWGRRSCDEIRIVRAQLFYRQ